jgi:hypothetical protein
LNRSLKLVRRPACGRAAGRVQAVSIDERLDIALSDGRIVRLGGLDAPTAERGAPEIAKAAREFLSQRLLGGHADLILLAGGTDRWSRTVADIRPLRGPWAPKLDRRRHR